MSSCTYSEILDTIPKTVEASTIGIIIFEIKFPINVTINKSTGCSKLADIIFPVVSTNVNSNGISVFENAIKLFTESFTMLIT